VFDSVINMPHRMTIYTTLVGLFNTKNYNAGGDVRTAHICLYLVFCILNLLII